MLKTLRGEIKYLITDWYKYMDTTVPRMVDRKLFTHLKYSNKNNLKRFANKYPGIDTNLLEKKAVYEYFKKPEEEILYDMSLYYGGIRYENTKGNGKRSR